VKERADMLPARSARSHTLGGKQVDREEYILSVALMLGFIIIVLAAVALVELRSEETSVKLPIAIEAEHHNRSWIF
jgi:hypothetical protein